MLKKNDTAELYAEDLNNLGYGVCHADGKTVFVAGMVDGDRAEIRIIKDAPTYSVGKIEKLTEPSRYRTDPVCPVCGKCGGCAYGAITYEREKELKRRYVEFAFRKAGLPGAVIGDVISDGVTCGYRNKALYALTVSGGHTAAGFYAPKSHRVVPVHSCALAPAVFAEIVNDICRYADEKQISVYNEENGQGLLRGIYIRKSTVLQDVSVCVIINGDTLPGSDDLAGILYKKYSGLTGFLLNINKEDTNVVLGEKYITVRGCDYICDNVCGKKLKIPAEAFFQVNTGTCGLLYGKVRSLLGENPGNVLDLYCGIGSIGICAASDALSITGIEIVPQAVAVARENALANGIADSRFLLSDASGVLETESETPYDVMIVDPPRKGITESVIRYAVSRSIGRIVYVSCNPATLARDCSLLTAEGYGMSDVTPVDMFPRTGHIECVVLLEKQ